MDVDTGEACRIGNTMRHKTAQRAAVRPLPAVTTSRGNRGGSRFLLAPESWVPRYKFARKRRGLFHSTFRETRFPPRKFTNQLVLRLDFALTRDADVYLLGEGSQAGGGDYAAEVSA